MTIEENADRYCNQFGYDFRVRNAYIKGATDQQAAQKKIDIEKAFGFMLKYLYDDNQFLIRTDAVDKYNYPIGWEALYKDDFYEIFKQAMEE